jgi:hypothetical protein
MARDSVGRLDVERNLDGLGLLGEGLEGGAQLGEAIVLRRAEGVWQKGQVYRPSLTFSSSGGPGPPG